MNKLKVAQVGVGNFGSYRRARMRETGLFELVAAYDFNAEALAEAEREDGAKPTSSYEELLSTPALEAVMISTGAKFHAAQALAAMERGLHVFIEKPLCSTPQELKSLLEAQQKSGVVVGVGHADHAHDAVASTIKNLIDSNQLGTIATFEKTTAHSGGFHIKPGDWRGDEEKNPGGMLFQCGVHAIHELMFYFGPIKRVSSVMRYDIHSTQTADVALCHLIFESGLAGVLNAYHITPYRHTLNVFGTKANLYQEDLSFDEGTKLWKQTTHLDNAKESKEAIEITGESDACGNLRSFYHAVRDGSTSHTGTPYTSLQDAALTVAVVFAATTSAKEGRVVDVQM